MFTVPRQTVSTVALSIGSGLTGAGTVLPGVLLPVLSQRWGLRDDQAGLLLFLQFFASGLGAICTGFNRVRSLAIGFGLLTVTACLLGFAGSKAPYAVFFFYGLGLGMAMTATSLLFSDRWGNDRAAKLQWLNFAWSAGATAGPVFLPALLIDGNTRSLFLILTTIFFVMFAWVVLFERQGPKPASALRTEREGRSIRTVFTLFLLLAMCTVGVEAALSGWLTTYSHRAGLRSLAGAAFATSVFWLGEMAGRLVFSTSLLARIGARSVLRWGIWGATIAAAVLVAAPHPWLILVAAGFAGAMIGPLYPLTLSFLLELSPWGWIFAVGGMGAALFPWLTGLVSVHYHSLRYGLVVPCAAGVVMIVICSMIFRPGIVAGVQNSTNQ